MKKFLIKMTISLSIVLIPLMIISVLYKNTNAYLSSNELYKVRVYPENISLLNLGNSREMYGISYDNNYNGVAHNFASSSQPLYYDLQVLKEAKNSINKDAIVFIPLSYFDWTYDWRELFKKDIGAYNKRYYGIISPQNIYNFNIEEYFKYSLFPALTAKSDLKYILNDIDIVKGYSTDSTKNIEQEVKYTYSAWRNNVEADKEDEEEVIKGNVSDFKNLLNYCLKMGYQPVVLISPITEQFTAAYPKEDLEKFYQRTTEVLKNYPDVLFLNYAEDPEVSTNLKYFFDAVHLNNMGGDVYMKKVLKQLVQKGYLDEKTIK